MNAAEQLKHDLGPLLVSAERVKTHPGIPTGHVGMDQFLLWQGLPKGALSLFYGSLGLGATSLWAQVAARVTAEQKWAAWLSGPATRFCPWALQNRKVDFKKLLIVSSPRDGEQMLWALQELMSLSLFELIGCDLSNVSLREHQLVKLRRMAERSSTALVLLSPQPQIRQSASYAVIAHFAKTGIFIERALHRPTPQFLTRRETHADFVPQLAKRRPSISG